MAGDVDALVACIDAAYAEHAARIPDLPPVSADGAEEIAQRQVWVAEIGDRIVGCLVLNPEDSFMKLANVAVHPGHRGVGLGRALLALADSEALDQGYSELRLNTHRDMEDNVRLYRRLGWQDVERRGNRVSMRKRI